METSSPLQTAHTRPRIHAFDALRVFAILTVLLIHACMTGREIGQPASLKKFDDWIHYAVPLFVFVSGALLWSRPWKGGNYGAFVKKRLLRVGPSYLFWTGVYLALLYAGFSGSHAIYAHEYNWAGLRTGGVDWLTNIIRIPGYLFSGHSWYHLYFIPMIFTFYLLTPLFARALRARKWSAELTVLLALALKIIAWPALSNALEALGNPFILSYASHIFQHLPNMALGGWFGIRFGELLARYSLHWTLRERKKLMTAIEPDEIGSNPVHDAIEKHTGKVASDASKSAPAVAGFSLKAWQIGLTSFWQIGIFAVPACLLEPLWIKIQKPLRAASHLSFGVYYIHALFVLIAQKLTLAFLDADYWAHFWVSWEGVFITWFFLIVASYGSCWLLSKSESTRWIIGL